MIKVLTEKKGEIFTFLFGTLLLVYAVYTFYPGFLNIDSEFQLQQALRSYYVDWHPPLMALVWLGLTKIYPGPVVMLVLHNIFFWYGLCLLSLIIIPNSLLGRMVFIIMFALIPAIYLQLGGIWKDVSMVMSFFLGSVLLLFLDNKNMGKFCRIFVLVLIILLLFYGYAVRLNSAPAVIMLCFWLGFILFKKRFFPSLILAFALFLGFFIANRIIVEKFLHPLHTFPYQQVLIHDLAAISVAKNTVIFPSYITKYKNVTVENIRKKYSPLSVGFLIFKDQLIELSTKPYKIQELKRLWFQTVLENPLIYLKHRTAVFFKLMLGCITYTGEVCKVPYHIIFHPTFFYVWYCKFVTSVVATIFFRGWAYVSSSLLALTMAICLRQQLAHYQAIIAITLSGLLYAFGGYFYAPAAEFRYLYWTVIATLLALSLLVRDYLESNIKI